MEKYDHRTIEQKWQQVWREEKLYETPERAAGKENHYVLVEFAYPSGNLHVGHWYAFSIPDTYARFMRMQGKNVMFPFGFDAFGLPAENAAIKRKLNPRVWTYENIDYMRQQLGTIGTMFDWSREVVTSDPEYYRWTQWLFLKLFERGLAYQAEVAVNWCPSCKTVLANEQVIAGRCERCESVVEQRKMRQWLLKITDYADRLIDDLAALDWPEPIKEAQRNWIGRSEGVVLSFTLTATRSALNASVNVFTTRPDTLFGATYLVLAPEHKLVAELLANRESGVKNRGEVEQYVAHARKKTELERQESREKTGIVLEGITAINPGNGEEIPIWVADYVLSGVGAGAIMAVPAHDQRDYEFAQKYQLPARQVIAPYVVSTGASAPRSDQGIVEFRCVTAIVKHWSEDKYYVVDFSEGDRGFIGGHVHEGETAENAARREVMEESGFTDIRSVAQIFEYQFGRGYKARKSREELCIDASLVVALASGTRVAITDDETKKGGWKTTDEILADKGFHSNHRLFFGHYIQDKCYDGEGILVNSGEFNGMQSEEARSAITEKVGGKEQTTYRLRDWIVSRQRYWGCPIPIIHCGRCGAVPVPAADLPVELPEIEDFLPSGDGKSPLAKVRAFVETSCPRCGKAAERETDTLDTFVDSSWYFLRYTDPKNVRAFAAREQMDAWLPVDFYSGGAEHTTMHLLYSRFFQKALYDLELVADSEPYARRMNRGIILGPDGQKMSKSRGNVIDPDDVVRRYGADTVRMYLAFIGPYNEVGAYPWSTEGIKGVRRFLERVWKLTHNLQQTTNDKTEAVLHRTIKQVGESIASLKMNTAVAALMGFINIAERSGVTRSQLEMLTRVLAPLAPHLSEELWRVVLGHERSVHRTPWPEYDEQLLIEATVTIVVQVNGKMRAQLSVPHGADESAVREQALALPAIAKWVGGASPKRVVYVPNRLLNIVLG